MTESDRLALCVWRSRRGQGSLGTRPVGGVHQAGARLAQAAGHFGHHGRRDLVADRRVGAAGVDCGIGVRVDAKIVVRNL